MGAIPTRSFCPSPDSDALFGVGRSAGTFLLILVDHVAKVEDPPRHALPHSNDQFLFCQLGTGIVGLHQGSRRSRNCSISETSADSVCSC